MALTPKQIFKDFKKNKIDKSYAAQLLIFIIENNNEIEVRLESIDILNKIKIKDKSVFLFLENSLISDNDDQIRILAARTLKALFEKKALGPFEWILNHEKSLQFLIPITSMISEIEDDMAKAILIDKIKNFQNAKFNDSIKNLTKTNKIHDLSTNQLADIINNYFMIQYIKETLTEFDYSVENGFITELNLSNINNNVFGWKILKNLTEVFKIFKELNKLDLKLTKIGGLPTSLGNLSSLAYLDLSYNKFREIPNSIFKLQALKYLDLKYNNLTELSNSIGFLKLLEILDLRHNKLTLLPNSISNLTSLKVLDLHGNQLTKIPNSLENLTSLKKLELGLNNLTIIPKWIKNFESLKKLGLSGNKNEFNLKELIANLPNLKNLNLGNNNIEHLPDKIGTLNSLEKLTLNNNQLNDLPKSLKNLTSLKTLDLSWNNFIKLPEWIGSLFNLEVLNLSGNKLNFLPESMGLLSSLKILNLKLNNDNLKISKSIKKLQDKGLVVHTSS
ncbi:MAG: leucine-rich repeat domain-containing protein [Promethearchaeota archaeon]